MNIVILLSVIFTEIVLIESASSENKWVNDVKKNLTIHEPNGLRFQRILRRKKRFLLFPPGSAIVTTMSFTKTLVPKSPSGINMIGECDIFYALQTQIQDWYPTKSPHVSAPSLSPIPSQEDDNDDDSKQGVLPANVGPLPPNGLNIPPPPVDTGAIPPNSNIPFLPTRLPSDQEIGITPGTIISDPNFNIGSHPGEIYVDDKKGTRKIPPRRQYSEYYSSSGPYQPFRPYLSSFNSTDNSMSYYDSMSHNHVSSFDDESLWHQLDENVNAIENEKHILSSRDEDAWQQKYRNTGRSRHVWSRGSRERRDLFDQFESFMSFEQFDTKSCILRMICEAKHYLLPPGKSLFHDIFRVLFTLPAEDGPIDDYVRATQATEQDCNLIYSKLCRFSVLGLLMSKERPSF